jgi:hypothetical protein
LITRRTFERLGKSIAGSVVSSPVKRHLEDTFDNQSVNDNDFDRDSARKNAPRAADDRKHIRDRMAYETRRCLKEYALPQRGRAMPNRPGGGCERSRVGGHRERNGCWHIGQGRNLMLRNIFWFSGLVESLRLPQMKKLFLVIKSI